MAFDKKGALVGAALFLIIVALVAFGRRPLLVAWHKWRMDAAMQNVSRVGPTSDQTPYLDSHDYHRQRLVDLGYFEHRTFRLKHIMTATPEYTRCWRLVLRAFPFTGYYNVQSGVYAEPTPMVLDVWERPERMHLWEEFVREHDVPDFAGRFGVDGE